MLRLPGDYRDLNVIRVFTKVTGTLVNETPLRVGVGREAPLGSPVDIAVFRVNGSPCIPGSSIKGVFRSFIESLAESMKIPVHPPFEACEALEKDGQFCEICGIFGSTELASHVRIHDVRPSDRRATTFVKTGVAIDREFKGARPGALYTEELISPGIAWTFQMDIYNIDVFPNHKEERGRLLRTLLDTLKSIGIQVGARKTVGYGLIKLKEGSGVVFSLANGQLNKVWEGGV